MIHSFAASTATIPPSVVDAIRGDIAEWRGSGQSVLELPFTGDEFRAILADAEADLRTLLALPGDYHVIFLQGGASTQFSLLPQNLLGSRHGAAYVETGHWSRRAMNEARPWCRLVTAAREADISALFAPLDRKVQRRAA
jgi:phosphoserine aminotransferase